jgi:hypothetical protein
MQMSYMKKESSQDAEIDLSREEGNHQGLKKAYTVITILLILTFFASTIYIGISCFFTR